MRTVKMWLVATMAVLAACGDNLESTEQAVGGPTGVMVTPRAVGQLAVSWTADSAARKYYVFQGAAGGQLAFVASMVDGDRPPPTSYIATELTDGVAYCFAISSVFADGSESDMSAVACSSGATPPLPRVSSMITLPAQVAVATFGSPSLQVGGGGWNFSMTGTSQIVYPIVLPVGSTLLSWSLGAWKQSTSAVTMQVLLTDNTGVGLLRSGVTVTQQINSQSTPGAIAFSGATPLTIAPSHSYTLIVENDGVGNLDQCNDLIITYQ